MKAIEPGAPEIAEKPAQKAPVVPSPVAPDMIVIESPFRLELVRVPAGEFLMGSDPAKDRDARDDEQPQHSVYVSEFHIALSHHDRPVCGVCQSAQA